MKKNTFLLCLLLLCMQVASAQLTKGNWLVGGNASFSSTKFASDATSKSTYTNLRLSPNVGYFLSDRLATGLRISFSRETQDVTGSSIFNQTNIDLGPFARYYFLPTEQQLNILFDASYQYGKNKSADIARSTLMFNAGPVFYFNSSVGLEFLAGYSIEKYQNFSGSNTTFSLSIGFQIHLEKN